MIASTIREFSASKEAMLLAAAFFEKTVQIWDLQSYALVSEFPTVFCAGAKNLAFAPAGNMLVTGLSVRAGKVAAYDILDGRLKWQHKATYPSSLRFHPSGESLWYSSDNRSIIRVEVDTGTTIEIVHGLSHSIQGPYGVRLDVLADRTSFRICGETHGIEIPRGGLAFLDAQFSPDAVCVAEAGGQVRCIDSNNGTQRWTFDAGVDSLVLLLHYSPSVGTFFGVLKELENREGRYLVRFDSESGACDRICKLDSWAEVFIGPLSLLVTSAGEIRNLLNGALIARLAFPLREYPDT